MSAEAAGAADAPLPPPPAAAAALPPIPPSRSVSSFASEAELQEDVALYADLPLGSASSLVLQNGGGDTPEGAALTAGRRRYLCYFRHRYLEFRLPEVEALADAARRRLASKQRRGAAAGGSSSDDGSGGNGSGEASSGTAEVPSGPAVVWEKPFGNRPESPFWYAHLDGDEVAKEVATKMMLPKVLLEVWGESDSLEGLRELLAAYPQEQKDKWGGLDQSFKFIVEAWGHSYTMREQVALIESMEPCCRFQGPIDLKHPQNRFWLIIVRNEVRSLPLLPDRYYFGREVGAADRSPLNTYDLRRRRYLGPTSMDTEMAFLMCNMAQVGRGSLVMDPFVGTGSCLVPAAHLGAYTIGTDIDVRVIKLGKKDKAGRPVNVWTNFQDYQLQPPVGLLRCDLHTHPFRDDLEEVLHAIVCDPPYGVRAGGRKSVPKDREIRSREDYIPSTDPYSAAECMHDLLETAARLLVVGGRLVYFLAAAPGFYSEEEVPQHPMLEVVYNCEQHLTTRYTRRLITMQKVKRYDAAEAQAFYEARGPPKLAIDDMHDYIYKSPAQLAAEAGMSVEEYREQQGLRIPRNRGKNI
ncbi:hypothetical protein COHA_009361 [Chlorella ohadii]|uniref:tRNA (guanine(10)-N(2))-methyltransferase n=1 Tax=Chlorella ohadii TaxID=2649997 RepID=A0AAD5GXX5_9CHLO|nr:hypothetical protein COHA_009361 [Chlorella ohadii]